MVDESQQQWNVDAQPQRVVVLGRATEPGEKVRRFLGDTGKYLGLNDETVMDLHARICFYSRDHIEIEPIAGAPVQVARGDQWMDVQRSEGIKLADRLRIGLSDELTLKSILERSLASDRPRRGLGGLVEGSSNHVIRDYGEIKGKYEVLDEAYLDIGLRISERDVLAFARPSGASADRLSVFYDHHRHNLALPRVKSLEASGYSVDRVPASRQIVQQIRQDLDAKESEAESEQNSQLYNEFRYFTARAIEKEASDIHVEVRDQRAWLRYRIHGELETQTDFSPQYALRLMRAVHFQAVEGGSSAFNEARMDQGQIEDTFEQYKAGLRVQIVPCAPRGSFDLQARVLLYESDGRVLDFEEMGYHPSQAKQIRRSTARPQGATVIAGTTGSGKSTTLDNVIRGRVEFYNGTKKIITIEEPVERVIPGTTQIEINRAADEGNEDEDSAFARAITASMRADPDLLMIQEVRDADTAQLFSRATLSGHAVYTTTHTGAPFEVISRLTDLGIPEHILQSHGFLNALIHQRLVPVHCPDCAWSFARFKNEAGSSDVFREFVGRVEVFFGDFVEHLTFRGEGCASCKKTARVGREVCAEVVEVKDDEMRRCLVPSRLAEARERWLKEGNLTEFGHGVLKVLDRKLSPRELEGLVDTIPEEPLAEFFGAGHIVTERFEKLTGEHGSA